MSKLTLQHLFFNKVADWRPGTLLKRNSSPGVYTMNFAKFINEWLLLIIAFVCWMSVISQLLYNLKWLGKFHCYFLIRYTQTEISLYNASKSHTVIKVILAVATRTMNTLHLRKTIWYTRSSFRIYFTSFWGWLKLPILKKVFNSFFLPFLFFQLGDKSNNSSNNNSKTRRFSHRQTDLETLPVAYVHLFQRLWPYQFL